MRFGIGNQFGAARPGRDRDGATRHAKHLGIEMVSRIGLQQIRKDRHCISVFSIAKVSRPEAKTHPDTFWKLSRGRLKLPDRRIESPMAQKLDTKCPGVCFAGIEFDSARQVQDRKSVV